MEAPGGDWGGPYVTAAFFCEDVKMEAGRISFRRLVDRLVAMGETAAADLYLIVAVRPGNVRGPLVLNLTWRRPSGQSGALVSREDQRLTPVERDDDAINWRIPAKIETDEEGLHWFDVAVNGRFLTRVPLRVDRARHRVTIEPPPRPKRRRR